MVAVPFCRCRVLYIGSAVPTITKDGLQGIQQPLRERYPIDESADAKGIDSWLSVWSNGILLEYIDGDKKTETAFHPINSLHYCAAVRFVNVSGYAVEGGGERFLPLDSPFASNEDSRHPPLFAAIFRRTTGIRVLECHAFICTNAKAANALVRCCFHAYAESMYIKLDERLPTLKAIKEASRSASPPSEQPHTTTEIEEITAIEDDRELEQQRWAERSIGKEAWERRQQSGEYDSASISSSIANRFRIKKQERERTTGDQALIPYTNGTESFSRRAGSDVDVTYGGVETPFPVGMYPGMPPPHFRFGPVPWPHLVPGHPMLRPPLLMPFPPLPPPPHLLPPMHHLSMMPPPPPHFGLPPHLPPGAYGSSPPPLNLIPPRFMSTYGPISSPVGRPRTPDGPIITGPESVYGTLPRRPAYEEPIYMPGNGPYMPPQASYQPGSYPMDHYDAYYNSFKRQRTPHHSNKESGGGESQTSLKRMVNENDELSQFWDSYEASMYRKPHLNEKAFSATARSMPSATATLNNHHSNTSNHNTTGTSTVAREAVDNVRPETPPADYDTAFNNMHINNTSTSSNKQQHQQRTTAVIY